jgi:hypothetical protein
VVLVTTTTEQRATAFKALLAGLRVTFYDADEVPGTPGTSGPLPSMWGEVGLIRTVGGSRRLVGTSGVSAHYLTVGVGATNVTNVRQTHDAVRTRLEGALVTVGDDVTTAVQFYSEDPVEFISELGRFWQLVTYSYAI